MLVGQRLLLQAKGLGHFRPTPAVPGTSARPTASVGAGAPGLERRFFDPGEVDAVLARLEAVDADVP